MALARQMPADGLNPLATVFVQHADNSLQTDTETSGPGGTTLLELPTEASITEGCQRMRRACCLLPAARCLDRMSMQYDEDDGNQC